MSTTYKQTWEKNIPKCKVVFEYHHQGQFFPSLLHIPFILRGREENTQISLFPPQMALAPETKLWIERNVEKLMF